MSVLGVGGNPPTRDVFSPPSVPQAGLPNYGTPDVQAPSGYQPIQGSNTDYSGGGSTQPTMASSNPSWNWNSFGQNPKGYLVGQGLQAVGVSPNVAKAIGNPIGALGSAMSTATVDPPPPDIDAAGAEGADAEGVEGADAEIGADAADAAIGADAEGIGALFL